MAIEGTEFEHLLDPPFEHPDVVRRRKSLDVHYQGQIGNIQAWANGELFMRDQTKQDPSGEEMT